MQIAKVKWQNSIGFHICHLPFDLPASRLRSVALYLLSNFSKRPTTYL